MEKNYIDKWFKMPPKEQTERLYVIKPAKKGAGKRKNAKPRQKTKK